VYFVAAIYRGKPKATDVLSFPNHDAFAIDGDFPGDPDTFAQTEVEAHRFFVFLCIKFR